MTRFYLPALFFLLFGLSGVSAAESKDSSFELQDPAQEVADSIKEAEANIEKAKRQAAQQKSTHGAFKLQSTDYLALLVGNYVHGFKEFDTRVDAGEDSVSVGIYYDPAVQRQDRAEQLADRFRKHLSAMFEESPHELAGNVGIVVSVHAYDRSKGY